jgi:hypothetical protein
MNNLGALQRPKDSRDILLGTVQAPVSIPTSFVPDMTWFQRNYQGTTPFCGEHAGTHFQAILDHYQDSTVNQRYSPRYGTIKLKTPASSVYDGFAIDAGTSLQAIFKWLQKVGADSFEPLENDVTLLLSTYCEPSVITPAMDVDASNHKIANYAFDALTFQDLCQACYQSKAVILLLKVDGGFWGAANPTFTTPTYGHFVCQYGYDETGIWIIDSAESNEQFIFKHIDTKFITPTFFLESGTAIDASLVRNQIVSDTSQIVMDISQDTTDTPAVKESFLQEVEQILEKVV